MMKHFLIFVFCIFTLAGYAKKIPTVYIDGKGVMRWSDTRKEASFYGVNYTLPFAHAYRAMNYLGIDHKNAIDRDVYHIARLGLNAYRIHIWDVEIRQLDRQRASGVTRLPADASKRTGHSYCYYFTNQLW